MDSNELPISATEPYIPEVAYRTCDSSVNVTMPQTLKSRILQCSNCFLTVHARCYGIDDLYLLNDLTPELLKEDVHELKILKSWICDACRARVKPVRMFMCILACVNS